MSAVTVEPVSVMGTECSAKTLYRDPPYGGLIVATHERGEVFQLFMSEHTDIEAVAEMWTMMPASATYIGAEEVPGGFGPNSRRCVMHRFFNERGVLKLVRRLSPEVFFSTQKLG